MSNVFQHVKCNICGHVQGIGSTLCMGCGADEDYFRGTAEPETPVGEEPSR